MIPSVCVACAGISLPGRASHLQVILTTRLKIPQAREGDLCAGAGVCQSSARKEEEDKYTPTVITSQC